MAKPPALDDPELRDLLIAAIERHPRDADAAAREVGLTRQQVRRYAKDHPEFEARVTAARQRARALHERTVPPMAKALARVDESRSRERQTEAAESWGVPVELVTDADRLPGMSVSDVIGLVEQHAADPESRACGQALTIIAQLKLGPLIRAQQRREEREAAQLERASQVDGGPRKLVLELPDNGTHAARRRALGVIDAELVDDEEAAE